MKRRNFIQLSGYAAAGLAAFPGLLSSCTPVKREKEQPSLPATGFKINPNGTYNINTGDIYLRNCIPAIDGQAVIPVSSTISHHENGSTVIYQLTQGTIKLTFTKAEQSMVIKSEYSGFSKAPDWFYPLAFGKIEGANRFYKQGMGFAGPSGVYDIPDPQMKIESARLKEDVWSYESYMAAGLLSPASHTCAIGAFDHSQYLYRSTIYNHQHRFGLIDRHMDTNKVYFETGFAIEHIKPKGHIINLPDIHIFCGDDPFNTFRQYAVGMAEYNNVQLNHDPKYYYCSWYLYEHDFTQSDLKSIINGLNSIEPALPMQAIQIDAGYSHLGDWLNTNEKFPDGLKNAFDMIREAGFEAGIWVGPFMVNSNSFIYKEHPEWLLKDLDGNIIVEWEEDYHGGGKVCILDSSHPGAFEYLRKVFRTLKEWGASYYKTDFMDWGLQDSNKVSRYNPGKTSVQYFTEVVKMIREEIGNNSYWLGCISPFQQMIGYVDGMRITNDVHTGWTRESTINMFRETFAGQYFNNILWQNDPDVLYVREEKNKFTEDETYSLALWDGITGGVVNTSDALHEVPVDRLQLWRFVQPGKEKKIAKLPFWADDKIHLVAVRDYTDLNAWGILIVNTSDEVFEGNYEIKELTGDIDEGYCYEWLPGKKSRVGKISKLKPRLRMHQSILYYVSKEDNPPAPDLGIAGIKIKGLG